MTWLKVLQKVLFAQFRFYHLAEDVLRYFKWSCSLSEDGNAACAQKQCSNKSYASQFYFPNGRYPNGLPQHLEEIRYVKMITPTKSRFGWANGNIVTAHSAIRKSLYRSEASKLRENISLSKFCQLMAFVQ